MLSDRKELVKRYAYGRVLDVGIRDGYVWGSKVPENVVGVDLEVWKHPNFVCADARMLPFRNSAFDTVVMTELLEHIAPDERHLVIGEAKRVCKGRIIISVPDGNDPRSYAKERDPYWSAKHPKCIRPLPPDSIPHHMKEWMYTADSIRKLAEELGAELFEIENRYYKGWGLVVNKRYIADSR